MLTEYAKYLPAPIIVFFLVRRTQRPRRIRPMLLWIMPVLLLALGILYTLGAVQKAAALDTTDVLIVVGTALLGIALGVLRGNTIHLARDTQTGIIEGKLSMWGLVVLLLWWLGRNILHDSGQQEAASPFSVFDDAMLALAITSVTARTIVLFKRCTALAEPEIRGTKSSSAPS